MTRIIDLTGQRFGRLVVIEQGPIVKYGADWVCRCDCGEIFTTAGVRLRRGNCRSCGCIVRERIAALNASKRKTGHSHGNNGRPTATYYSWVCAISRCYNQNATRYERYGGRGIKVCDRWLGEHGFENFLRDMGERPPGKTLDRFPDKDGDYEPKNCRWATRKEQARNRVTNRLNEKAVSEIRNLTNHGFRRDAIAKLLGIDARLVSQVALGRRWA